jgi:hypothetical protein
MTSDDIFPSPQGEGVSIIKTPEVTGRIRTHFCKEWCPSGFGKMMQNRIRSTAYSYPTYSTVLTCHNKFYRHVTDHSFSEKQVKIGSKNVKNVPYPKNK